MDEQLEIQSRRQATGGAVAARGRVDAPEPPSEGQVAGLDGVHQERAIGPAILDEEEASIPLELREAERRVQPTHDGLEEVAGDHRRVLELAARQVGRVSGEVRDDEEAGLG